MKHGAFVVLAVGAAGVIARLKGGDAVDILGSAAVAFVISICAALVVFS